MNFDINLITKEEKQEQIKNKIVKSSSILTVFLLIIVALITGYFYFKVQGLKNEIKAEDQKITDMRSQIKKMASVEVTSRNLYQKYTILKSIFSERIYNSYFVSHFNSKIPSGVIVDSFSPTDTSISISGTAPSYLAVSELLRNFSEKEDRQVFTSAQLQNVNLNTADRSVKYSLIVNYDQESLKFDK